MPLNFQEPPEKKAFSNVGASSKYTEIARELRENPGKWALLKRQTYTTSSSLRSALKAQGEGFEITMRSTDETKGGKRVYEVYVRFNPDLITSQMEQVQ